jgi:transposase
MPKRERRDPKADALREQGTLNPRPQDVTDELFGAGDFFDPRDLVQVKYEMVRRVEADGQSVTRAATGFGFSRPSFYQAQSALRRHGLAGLLPKKRGPRGAYKLSAEVVAFIEQVRAEDESLRAPALAQRVEQRFGVRVHPRSIERALGRREKKRR